MSARPDPGTPDSDDRQAEQWIATLRDGSPAEKAAARRGLAGHFEARGMVAEAIDLLVANAREGYRDVELFQALARLYRAQGNEYLAASAALEATRLSGRRSEAERQAGQAGPIHSGPASRCAPWGQDEGPRPAEGGPAGQPAGDRSAGTERVTTSPSPHTAWRRPARILGWLAVVVTVLAALGVSSTSGLSAALYVVSAAALGVLLSGSTSARRLLRLPAGPLGDGALVFAWLLLLLVAGSILPRGSGGIAGFSPATPEGTPSLYRTPVASVTPAPAATLAPRPSPGPP
jgi:hypothetical protein